MTMQRSTFDRQVKGTGFIQDLKHPLILNGSQVTLGGWNLILSIRDLKLFTKGIKPHRNWRLTPVKKYFGITGGKEKVLTELEAYLKFLK